MYLSSLYKAKGMKINGVFIEMDGALVALLSASIFSWALISNL